MGPIYHTSQRSQKDVTVREVRNISSVIKTRLSIAEGIPMESSQGIQVTSTSKNVLAGNQ